MGIGKILFSFDGRINRAKFWLGYILAAILCSVLIGIAIALVPWDQVVVLDAQGQPVLNEAGEPQLNFEGVDWTIPGVLFGLSMLLSLITGFALMVKRCHDRGFSGWYSLIALIPLAGGIWMLIALGIMEGEKGTNKWGPDPLAGRRA